MTTERSYAGVSMVDSIVDLARQGSVFRTRKDENVFLEDTFVRGAASVQTTGERLPSPESWTNVDLYSSHKAQGVTLINGTLGSESPARYEAAVECPSFETLAARHYSGTPSFEDADAVNVKEFGAEGDGETDDTEAFRRAIAAGDKVFLPKGDYALSGTLRLRANTRLFGFSRSFVSLGSGDFRHRGGEPGRSPRSESFVVETVDDADAAPGLLFLTVRGRVHWKSGRGNLMLARAPLEISGNGGGRFYGLMAMGRPFVLDGLRQPTRFYALNVERVTTNPQSEFRDCEHVRVYYLKVESGSIQRPNAGDENTPCRISNSEKIRVYCMYGNVKKLVDRPMLEVVDSQDVLVSQLKAFRPGSFPHLIETFGEKSHEIPSSKTCALFVRDGEGDGDAE
jgi:hypothetical protein